MTARRLLFAALCGSAALGGCATRPPEACAGLPDLRTLTFTNPDGTEAAPPVHSSEPARVAHLQCFAALGNQAAEVELARRYETGAGVPLNIDRAIALYERAALDVPRTMPIYSPPVRLGGSGTVMQVPNPNGREGSPEARFRLGLLLLTAKAEPRQAARARQLIERAAAAGHAPAREWLSAEARQAR